MYTALSGWRPTRAVTAAAFIAIAALVTLWLVIREPTPPPIAAPATGSGVPADVARSNRIRLLDAAPYLVVDPTSAQVQRELEETLRTQIVEVPTPNSAISAEAKDRLVSTLKAHLLARADPSVDAYMKIVDREATSWRTADQIGKSWVNIQGPYEQAFGMPPPRDDARRVLTELIEHFLTEGNRLAGVFQGVNGMRLIVGRVKSPEGLLDFLSRSPGPPGLGHWAVGASASIAKLRTAKTSLADVIKRDGSAETASVHIFLKFENDLKVVFRSSWFYDPLIGQWMLHGGSYAGNPGAFGYY